ncbi:BBE domain-containing protein [Leptolyngbya sp. FACHB-541]|nr:BBE domain-containing protein [Leptolyngbya sp. FACHB-541]
MVFSKGDISILDEHEQKRVLLAFGSNYERLLDLKQKYELDDVFHSTLGHLVLQHNNWLP